MTDPNRPNPPSGLVLIDKPAGKWATSMKVVNRVKRRLEKGGVTDPFRKRGIRVGHAGTLDPLASGLLIVLVGKATGLCDQLMAGEKTYRAVVDLAHASNTDDLEGTLTPNPVEADAAPSRERVEAVLRERFIGVVQQKPPSFSAIWINAERAYDLAREGRAPEMVARPVRIHAIEIERYAWPELIVHVRCGKGTYIRSLARDVGVALTGHSGCLTGLRRMSIGPYRVEDAMDFERLPEVLGVEHLRAAEVVK